MAIWLHHGPPGSYKTSGAIARDVLPAIKAGRLIITNTRGFSVERCRQHLRDKDIGDGFDVLFIDTDKQEGRDKLARFFHWAPKGAFFLLDECQRIFRPGWRQSDLDALAYPGGPAQATADDRPETIEVAWDMHRHHNWDFVLTTPNIGKIRSEIKEAAEQAYRHCNMGILGFRGRYKTIQHSCDNNGSSATHAIQVHTFKKVPKVVFKLYDSTATGQHSDSAAGSSILKDPKLLVLLALEAAFVWAGFFHDWGNKATAPAAQNPASVSSASHSSPAGRVHSERSSSNSAVDDGTRDPVDIYTLRGGPFDGYRLVITGSVMVRVGRSVRYDYLLELVRGDESVPVNLDDYHDFLSVRGDGPCFAVVGYDGGTYRAMCDPAHEAKALADNRALFASAGRKPLQARTEGEHPAQPERGPASSL